jgi:4-alpha-glucanotransferase
MKIEYDKISFLSLLKIWENLCKYPGCKAAIEDIHWKRIGLAMMTIANTTVIQMQDILDLDGKLRMNRPGSADGN